MLIDVIEGAQWVQSDDQNASRFRVERLQDRHSDCFRDLILAADQWNALRGGSQISYAQSLTLFQYFRQWPEARNVEWQISAMSELPSGKPELAVRYAHCFSRSIR